MKSGGGGAVEVGGTPAIDIITLRAVGPGAPLRYGNVVPNSERVQLDNERLQAGPDYAMDYATGVVYLKRAQHLGQRLTVSYRYNPKLEGKQTPLLGFASGGTYKFDLVPGGFKALMGMGIAERSADGSVMQSNVFGFNNAFKFGGGRMNGLFIYGDRTKADNQAGLKFDMNGTPGQASTDEGKSQFMLQNLSSNVLGGTAQFDYQDISKNFTSFGAVKDGGYDDAAVQRFSSERGLKRFGMSLKDMKFGGLDLSQSYRTVSDDKGSVSWRSFGLAQGGLKLTATTQRVDQNFSRFKDIAEADRDQLMREAGMSRQNLSGEFAQKVGKLSFTSNTIQEDAAGNKISRQEYALDVSHVKFNLGQQDVGAGFTRFANLMGPEQAMYGREAGIHRQWMSMETAVCGKNTPLTMSQSILGDKSGGFRSQEVALQSKGWALLHSDLSSDRGFTRMNAMADSEMDNHIKAIAAMYGPNVVSSPNDRAAFLGGVGIRRSYTSLSAQPFKKWNLNFDQLDLKGHEDKGGVTSASLTSPNIQANYRHQELGKKFSESTLLMGFEQQKLGTISGLDRTDFGFNAQFGARHLTYSRMTADTPGGSANRTSMAYVDKKIDVQVNTREVQSGFTNAGQLVDAENAMLQTLVGTRETDAKMKWALLPGLNLDAQICDAVNEQTNQVNRLHQMALDWTPNGTTKLQYFQLEQENHNPLSTMFARTLERLSVSKSFGRYGVFNYREETGTFDKKQTDLTDYRRQYLSYEAKVDDRTSLRTEQTLTDFGNGSKEDVSANTVSTTLTKRLGVSVTDLKVDRSGDSKSTEQNVAHRNYGFWYDFGHGLILSYGYARQLVEDNNGTKTSGVSIGQTKDAPPPDKVGTVAPGTVGDVSIGGAYGANEWDANHRTQSFSNIAVQSAKPLSFGAFKEVKFNFGLDTAADNAQWLRENKLFGFSGKLGANSFSFDYKGQMDQSGYRAIDRSYRLQTDQSDKNWLRATMYYKIRTMPWDEQIMIRDFNIAARPAHNLEIAHELKTNPEVFQANALLGSVVQAAQSNKWRVDYKKSANLTFGGSWEELVNGQNKALSTTSGINLKLFEKSGSPVSLFYGVEQVNQTGGLRRTTQRYSLQFDQRPGPNQLLSLFVGNVSYQHSIPDQFRKENWTMRLDYQFRF
ncbi:hypothetical protein [Fimbriimonas ginsengisoli]|nr:hypothetical protein [Fimbriimonas ginsengisoli]